MPGQFPEWIVLARHPPHRETMMFLTRYWLWRWHKWRQRRNGMAFLIHENCARALVPGGPPPANNIKIEVWNSDEKAEAPPDLRAGAADQAASSETTSE